MKRSDLLIVLTCYEADFFRAGCQNVLQSGRLFQHSFIFRKILKKTPYLLLFLLQPWISAAQNLISFANIFSYH